MNEAGLFAGEATEIAPPKDAPTDKPKGYVWMEYGEPVVVVAEDPPVVPDP